MKKLINLDISSSNFRFFFKNSSFFLIPVGFFENTFLLLKLCQINLLKTKTILKRKLISENCKLKYLICLVAVIKLLIYINNL